MRQSIFSFPLEPLRSLREYDRRAREDRARVPAFAVRCLMGEMGEELLLSSTRVVPAALERRGFSFRFSDLTSAIASILDRP